MLTFSFLFRWNSRSVALHCSCIIICQLAVDLSGLKNQTCCLQTIRTVICQPQESVNHRRPSTKTSLIVVMQPTTDSIQWMSGTPATAAMAPTTLTVSKSATKPSTSWTAQTRPSRRTDTINPGWNARPPPGRDRAIDDQIRLQQSCQGTTKHFFYAKRELLLLLNKYMTIVNFIPKI
jgi:hypothetical protein